jgi:hypothetical protein
MSLSSSVYRQCGMLMRSEVSLDLPVTSNERWDVDVRWGPDVLECADPPPGELLAEYVSGDTHWYTLTDTGLGLVLRFKNCGEFVISYDLTEVVIHRDPSGRSELLPVLLAGTASAVLLTLRGATVLHASAVSVDGVALAFVGQSGRGKTTVAALMCLEGAQLVTDDVLAVEVGSPATCIGGATALRLRSSAAHLADRDPLRESYTTVDERRTFSPTAVDGHVPLGAIVIPSPSRTASMVAVRLLAPSEAVFALLQFPRIHGWRSADVLTRDFTVLSQLVTRVPAYEATIPWGPPFTSQVAQTLSELATLPDPRQSSRR